MRTRLAMLLVLLSAALALAVLYWTVPSYFTEQGFPLDDTWIHLVYGRSVAWEGSLAYQPGVPSTGATSPLWAAFLALPHLATGTADPAAAADLASVREVIALVKLLGALLHVAAACLFVWAWSTRGRISPAAAVGTLLFALHPDIVAAAVSGMEVPLSTVALGLVVAFARSEQRHAPVFGALAAVVAFLARPELAIIALGLPILVGAGGARRKLVSVAAAFAGITLAGLILAVRHLAASGHPLPATFYAKAATERFDGRIEGLLRLPEILSTIPIGDATLLIAALLLLAVIVFARLLGTGDAKPSRDARLGAAIVLLGALGATLECVLVQPTRFPQVFYYQRYLLPFFALFLIGAPIVVADFTARIPWSRTANHLALATLAAVALSSFGLARGARFTRLLTDARNIDDVQVAIGRTLGAAAPGDVTWVIDAGAARYFGRGTIIDLIGLNTPQILEPTRDEFLAKHPPRYLEYVESWTELEPGSANPWLSRRFVARPPFTVTNIREMAEHQLVECPPGDTANLSLYGHWEAHVSCAANVSGPSVLSLAGAPGAPPP